MVKVEPGNALNNPTPVFASRPLDVLATAAPRRIVVVPINFSRPSSSAIAQATPHSFVLRSTTGDGHARLTCESGGPEQSTWDVLVQITPGI